MAALDIGTLTDGTLNGTTNEWEGTGIFDVLMNAVNKNIESQYEQSRIDGNDYATVYLGGLQTVVQQSIQFMLEAERIRLSKLPTGSQS